MEGYLENFSLSQGTENSRHFLLLPRTCRNLTENCRWMPLLVWLCFEKMLKENTVRDRK